MARSVKSKPKTDPADWQEAHSPTMPELVRITGQRSMTKARRRTSAVRLFDGLDGDMQDGMMEINYTYNSFPGKPNIMMYERDYVPGTGDRTTHLLDLRRQYFEWSNIGLKGKFNHAAAMDIIGLGMTLEQVDKNRRRRHGWAKENMVDSLKVWLDLRGRR